MRKLTALLLAVTPSAAAAHAGASDTGGVQTWIALSLAAALIVYAAGLARVWTRGGLGRGVSCVQASAFAAGWLSLLAAASEAFEGIAVRSFAAHMLQHEVLMLVAAPLLVAGRPLAVFAWALPRAVRLRLHPLLSGPLRAGWTCFTAPVVATFLQLAALWAWHAPGWFDRAVQQSGLHALQHATFLVLALCFWWAVRDGVAGRAAESSGYLFITMIGSGALGALLAFSSNPWYASYGSVASPFGWTALEEQQVGGLLMWIPGGTVYMGAALWRVHRALRAAPRLQRMAARHSVLLEGPRPQ